MITFLSIGSNIGNKQYNIESAIKSINSNIGEVISISKIYKSAAWGFESENNFLNNAIKVETSLSPQELLTEINKIEKQLGRKRAFSGYSDRIIDIDILFYDDLIIDEPNLKIPHPLLQDRNFVLFPLCEIAKDYIHPILKKKISELLSLCTD
jgi:2-amino-4-hydroxy-6-hydroxymethyldihydropteridine diphosphokinase